MNDSVLNPVKSSTIKAIGYLSTSRLMYVQFKRGDLYEYKDVPIDVYHALMSADSKGKYLGNHIRDRFEFKKVDRIRDEKPLINILFTGPYSLGSTQSYGVWF